MAIPIELTPQSFKAKLFSNMRSIRAAIRNLGLTEVLMWLETRPAHKRAVPLPAYAENVLSNTHSAQ